MSKFRINSAPGILPVVAFSLLLSGCFRGMPSEKPPVHLIRNMFTQPKYKPQSESHFFADHSTMRLPPEHTVARGALYADDAFYRGRDAQGNYVKSIPMQITMADLKRGQQRYNIYCRPCHGAAGDGQGIITRYNYPIPPINFHTKRVLEMADGNIYEVISKGVRNMPSYGAQIPPADRWRIVAYVRALERSWQAKLDEIPPEKRMALK